MNMPYNFGPYFEVDHSNQLCWSGVHLIKLFYYFSTFIVSCRIPHRFAARSVIYTNFYFALLRSSVLLDEPRPNRNFWNSDPVSGQFDRYLTLAVKTIYNRTMNRHISAHNVQELQKEVSLLRSAVISIIGKDDEGVYRPETDAEHQNAIVQS